ncbi:MAG: hypothetical protein YK1309IOTA_50004 [Marine Group I thaumarchaeote]|nr:MAG: hypothetical protein YK1309IOTA_50004 [Marine Group I thaumarchaeote]
MGKTISKSISIVGNIESVYDSVLKKITALDYVESSSVWPSKIEFKRGKGGLFAKSLLEVKTTLKVSLEQVSDHINISFEYSFSLPSSFVDKDDNEINKEFMKIKQELSTTDVPSIDFDPTKLSFGVKIIDNTLYGGIPKNSVTVITSPACKEKEIMVSKFVETGLNKDEIVVYVSSNDKILQDKNSIQNQKFYTIICNAKVEVRRTSEVSSKNKIKVGSVEQLNPLSYALQTVLNNISDANDDEKPKRLILDIVSDVLLFNQSLTTRKWLGETITKFNAKNFTVLTTLNPKMHSTEDVQVLLDLFDGQIDLYEKDSETSSKMYMKIKRLKDNKFSDKEITLTKNL